MAIFEKLKQSTFVDAFNHSYDQPYLPTPYLKADTLSQRVQALFGGIFGGFVAGWTFGLGALGRPYAALGVSGAQLGVGLLLRAHLKQILILTPRLFLVCAIFRAASLFSAVHAGLASGLTNLNYWVFTQQSVKIDVNP